MIYIFDTNSLSELNAYYPDIFKAFWTKLDALVAAGEVISTREVKTELEASGLEHVLKWTRANSGIFTMPWRSRNAVRWADFCHPAFSGAYRPESSATRLNGCRSICHCLCQGLRWYRCHARKAETAGGQNSECLRTFQHSLHGSSGVHARTALELLTNDPYPRRTRKGSPEWEGRAMKTPQVITSFTPNRANPANSTCDL